MPTDTKDEGRPSDNIPVLTVETRDSADSTIDSVSSLVAKLGGTVKSQKGTTWKIQVQRGSDVQPDVHVARTAEHLRADPLVADVQGG